MKNNGKILGSKELAVPVVVGKNRIDLHTNIRQLDDNLYEYDEISYTPHEYIAYLTQELEKTQLALLEVFEKVEATK